MKQCVIIVLKFYRVFISPAKRILTLGHGVCRYHPTCSQYAIEAVTRFGVLDGLSLTISRLLRCHPWGGCGCDPVPTKSMIEDEKWMLRAIKEAKKGLGKTHPNPAVGAVIVLNGILIGAGYHRAAGKPHAEPEAINDALKNHHSLKGATIYVTLEPCSTYGRTPPCTQAIIKASISRVVVGSLDPNPAHFSKAKEILENAGIDTTFGILEEKCRSLNPEFFEKYQ